MRFGTGTTVKDLVAYRDWLHTAEACGFDLLTTGDSQSLWAEPFVSMTVAAAETSRARLAITVTNPMTRHPAVMASAAAAVQQLSGGRLAVGLSSGDSALRNIGVRPATVAEIERYAVALGTLTAGGTVDWDGHPCELRWLGDDPTRVPVWLAAEGPRTQELAGRIADGVVLSNCLTPEMYALALSNIERGARAVGRRVEDLEIWCMANLVLAPTEAEGIASVRYVLAGTANHVYRFTTEGKGLPPELVDRVEALKKEYDSRHHAQGATAQANAELVVKYGLESFLARLGTIAGPPEHCIERLQEISAAGPQNLIVSQFVDEPMGWMRTLSETILPAMA